MTSGTLSLTEIPHPPEPETTRKEGGEGGREADPLLRVSLDHFQGPLDLLLHLIRKQDIDIFDIPVAKITAQFLEMIRGVERLELEKAGEFIEMAATLVRIKAQMLFPRKVEEEYDDPRADLVRRLLEYEHFREVARVLDGAERARQKTWRKGYVQLRPRPAALDLPLETGWAEVESATKALAARLARPEPGYRFQSRPVRMEEKIEHILLVLMERARVEFSALVSPWGTRMHAVMSLLACLELAKRSTLSLRQESPFATLWVYRKDDPDAA
ncbi:MAG: segregation/condensation protein A [Gemmatimonadota bacterium]|nr:segregation/condensation protein A [Gemmatimonadota bacterium]